MSDFFYGEVLILTTTMIHAGCTALVLGWLRSFARYHWAFQNNLTRAVVLALMVFFMSLAAFVESAVWAGFYVAVGALSDQRDALYFSIVTFTSLGYGDVTLDDRWRILGALEAANGIILFGWTTALIVTAAQRLFFQHPRETRGS